MRLSVLLLCALVGVALANSRWQGSWTDGKRNFGGTMYLCVDGDRVYGTYSGAGLISGNIRGNQLIGEWHEAGYFSPYGTFTLTISNTGNSVSGSWKYSEDSASDVNWTATKFSTDIPTAMQCLRPASNGRVAGVYENTQNVCYNQKVQYPNTKFSSVYADFEGFGAVLGYTQNGGKSALLSNYVAGSSDSIDNARPENAGTPFGPTESQNPAIVPGLTTDRIAIGVSIDASTFCGFFWKGFYNSQIGDEAICIRRTSISQPTDLACGVGTVTRQKIAAANDGLTDQILEEVQRALDALTPPPIIVNGNPVTPTTDDDDDDTPAPGTSDDDDDDTVVIGGDDDDNANGNPIIYIVYVGDDDDDNNYVIVYADDDDNGNQPIYLPIPPVPAVPFIPPVQDPVIINVPVFIPVPTQVGDDDDDQVPVVIVGDDNQNPIVVPVPVPGVTSVVSNSYSDFDDFFGSPSSTLVASFGLIALALLI